MPDYTLTPNMSLLKPIPGQDPGPDYATNQNTDMDIIDVHDHSPGKGVPITPDSISITSDLSFNQNNAIDLRSVRFTAQVAPLALATDLGCVYVAGVDLYYNDGIGNQVRITQSGGVAGSPGSISNLTSPASAAYVSANSTFVWESDADTAANMDAGSLLIREKVANANAVTIASPTSLASNYQLTLPAALPASTTFVVCDSSGNLSVPTSVVDGTSLQQSGSTLSIKDGGVTRPKLAALGEQVSTTTGAYTTSSASFVDVTNATVTITTTGRPVQIMFIPDGDTSVIHASVVGGTFGSGSGVQVNFQILRGSTVVAGTFVGGNAGGGTSFTSLVPPGTLNFLDRPVAGTYTYKLQVRCFTATTAQVSYVKMIAFEVG